MKNFLFTTGIFIILLLSLESCDNTVIVPKDFPPPAPCPGVAEVEFAGEVYPTVQIGNQCWLAKNLNVGKRISHLEESKNNDTIEKYCAYNLESNCDKYGGLYKWDEVMQYSTGEASQGICPEGWHIPTNDDFVELYLYVDGLTVYLEDTSYSDRSFCKNCVGKTGFNLLYGSILRVGYRFHSPFNRPNEATGFFTSNQHYAHFPSNPYPLRFLEETEKVAYYVRCIKDQD